MADSLSPREAAALASYERKLQTVRDNTALVAQGYGSGYYCWGDGGVGKSYNILKQFAALGFKEGEDFHLHNTRMSGSKLFDLLEEHPESRHLFEDIENIFADRLCLNLLRSALWGQEGDDHAQERLVTYAVRTGGQAEERKVYFKGQIFFTGNRPLGANPELAALQTRIIVGNPVPTRAELLAVMKSICLAGKKTDKGFVSPQAAMEVYDCYVAHLASDTKVDLRVIVRLLKLRLGTDQLRLTTTWQQQVTQAIAQSTESQQPLTRHQRVAQETDIALALHRQRLTGAPLQAEWTRRTGHATLDSYYRRLR